MAKQRITSNKKPLTQEQKAKKLEKRFAEWSSEITVAHAFSHFIVEQTAKQNSKQTLSFYNRCYKKFCSYLNTFNYSPESTPINILEEEITQPTFITYMKSQELNQQTINSYLRGFRSFGNFCEAQGYIEHFKCPIKEIQPPAKQVYTDKELERLMVKPPIEDFADFRTYCIISLILNTGARCNTILNIRIEDVDLEEGYITFNTTKAHKIVRLGLEKKTRRDLAEWVQYWRYDKGAEPEDYLFCNEYGEQMARSTFTCALSKYNRSRGVEKTSAHLLRHTFSKNWITSGGDIITLAQVLTHSELDMVKRYANLYGSDVKKEIEQHSTISQMKRKSGNTLKTQKKLF